MERFQLYSCKLAGSDEYIFETIALTETDFMNADQLTKDELWSNDAVRLEDVNHYRSDIRGPVASRRRFRRNGVSRMAKLWPGGKIPYAISPHYTSHERALLARAVKQYHEKTCVRFVPRSPGEPDYLFIGKVDGCFSEVGRTSGVQVLSLDNGCMEYATIIHEMMHVVGFYHEHGALDQFGKVDLSKTSYYGQPYDYRSILHYDSLAFSKNGFPTMLPKQKGFASTIGNAKDFSEIDLAKINRMYGCPERISGSLPFARAQVRLFATCLISFYSRNTVPLLFKLNENLAEEQAGCEDRITVCWWTQERCHLPSLKSMMRSLCARTCDLC
uniref:Metalloendopeptidase n=1 Tax=Ascaris lumbricoides TaxID=6252 RepID=A0A0M3HY88_ASCLU